MLVLRNGFTVVGHSACVSPENFDADVGRKIARQNAVDQIWPLLGFRLRDSLAVGEVAAGKMSPGPRCSWRRLVGEPRKRLIDESSIPLPRRRSAVQPLSGRDFFRAALLRRASRLYAILYARIHASQTRQLVFFILLDSKTGPLCLRVHMMVLPISISATRLMGYPPLARQFGTQATFP